MSIKEKKKRKVFFRILTAPLRALTKAKDAYVKSMTKYADSVAGNHAMPYQPEAQMPRSLSASTILRSSNGEGDDYRELIRAASARTYGHKSELDMYLKEFMKQQQNNIQHPPIVDVKEALANKSVRGPVMTIIEEGDEDKEGSFRRVINK